MESVLTTSAPSSTPAQAASTTPSLPPSTVLLVEDDKLSQRLVSMILTSSGHEVLVADSIADALGHSKKTPLVDLVVLDNQLGLEKGTGLIEEMRRFNFFNELPIIAYTESRDRDVVRRYLELGVQGFHLKPYKAETLLAELQRAYAKGRRENLIEPQESACRRLKVTQEQYAGLLNSGAGSVEESCQTVRRLLLSPGDPRLFFAFRSMVKQLNQLGVHIIDRLAVQAENELRLKEYTACTETLGIIDNLAMFLRRRALDYLALGDSVVKGMPGGTLAPFGQRKAVSSPAPAPAVVPVTTGAPYVRAILSQTIRNFGAQPLPRIMEAPFTGGELTLAGKGWTSHPAVSVWLDVMTWLHGVEGYTEQEMISALEALPGFESTIETVLNQLDSSGLPRELQFSWSYAVKKFGSVKGAILVAAGRLARGGLSGTIPLVGLRHHTIVLMLLGFEFARLLKLTLPHKVAIAALAEKLGLWTVAINEPLLAALALARAQHVKKPSDAEEEVLGLSFAEAGALWIEASGLETPQLYMDAARGISSFQESEITVALVHAVKELGPAVLLGEQAALTSVADVMRSPDYPLWQTMRRNNIPMPGEASEIVELILPIAKSVVWITGEILGQRSGS